MNETIDELYEQYLNEKLDLIFKINGKKTIKISNRKILNICKLNNYEIIRNYHDLEIIEIRNTKGEYSFIDYQGNLISSEWYDYVGDFHEGYAKVNKDGKYKFIIHLGNFVSSEWYDEVEDFHEGYSKVKRNGKYNFIDINGNYLLRKWIKCDYLADFSEGYAVVKLEDGKFNYINKEGTFLLPYSCDYCDHFCGGTGCIKKDGKYNLVDISGNLICEDGLEVDDIDSTGYYRDEFFVRGKKDGYNIYIRRKDGKFASYIEVKLTNNDDAPFIYNKQEKKYYIIDSNRNIINEDGFSEIGEFSEGYAYVRQADRFNFIDRNGDYLFKKWVISIGKISRFQNGLAMVVHCRKYNFIDKEGNYTNKGDWDDWYDEVGYVKEGYRRVKKGKKYNFIDSKGNHISEKWFDKAYDFSEGYALVKIDDKWNLINYDGTLLSKEGFNSSVSFNDGYGRILKDYSYKMRKYIDKEGNFLSNFWFTNKFGFTPKLYDYKIKKTIMGFVCKNEHDSFYMKYEPYYMFNSNCILCSNKDICYIYDRHKNSYKELGNCVDIYVQNGMILDKKNNNRYIICDTQIINITEYYNDNLDLLENFNIMSDVRIMSQEEFLMYNRKEIEMLFEREREYNEQIKKRRIKEEHLRKIEEEKDEQMRAELERQKNVSQDLELLRQLTERLKANSFHKTSHDRITLDESVLFVTVDDHKEINPEFASDLKFIDLSLYNFENVRINGVDFKESNINLDPQLVYKKDLSNCNFEGVYIGPFTNFSGVDIRGTRFGPANDKRRIDYFTPSFKYAIYDDTTTYKGIPLRKFLFTEIFGKNNGDNPSPSDEMIGEQPKGVGKR